MVEFKNLIIANLHNSYFVSFQASVLTTVNTEKHFKHCNQLTFISKKHLEITETTIHTVLYHALKQDRSYCSDRKTM